MRSASTMLAATVGVCKSIHVLLIYIYKDIH